MHRKNTLFVNRGTGKATGGIDPPKCSIFRVPSLSHFLVSFAGFVFGAIVCLASLFILIVLGLFLIRIVQFLWITVFDRPWV